MTLIRTLALAACIFATASGNVVLAQQQPNVSPSSGSMSLAQGTTSSVNPKKVTVKPNTAVNCPGHWCTGDPPSNPVCCPGPSGCTKVSGVPICQ